MNPIQTLRSGIVVVGLLFAGSAAADRDRFALPNDSWNTECGSCHVAYPPQLLPAASWDALFAGLGDHFGSDAALDAGTASALLDYARTNAGRSAGAAPPLRITDTPWFRREHDEVDAPIWKHAKVGSPANCAACHSGADSGDYDEDRIRIPR